MVTQASSLESKSFLIDSVAVIRTRIWVTGESFVLFYIQ